MCVVLCGRESDCGGALSAFPPVAQLRREERDRERASEMFGVSPCGIVTVGSRRFRAGEERERERERQREIEIERREIEIEIERRERESEMYGVSHNKPCGIVTVVGSRRFRERERQTER